MHGHVGGLKGKLRFTGQRCLGNADFDPLSLDPRRHKPRGINHLAAVSFAEFNERSVWIEAVERSTPVRFDEVAGIRSSSFQLPVIAHGARRELARDRHPARLRDPTVHRRVHTGRDGGRSSSAPAAGGTKKT